jgi:hypothetical protein
MCALGRVIRLGLISPERRHRKIVDVDQLRPSANRKTKPSIDDRLGDRLLALVHDRVHELRDNEIAELCATARGKGGRVSLLSRSGRRCRAKHDGRGPALLVNGLARVQTRFFAAKTRSRLRPTRLRRVGFRRFGGAERGPLRIFCSAETMSGQGLANASWFRRIRRKPGDRQSPNPNFLAASPLINRLSARQKFGRIWRRGQSRSGAMPATIAFLRQSPRLSRDDGAGSRLPKSGHS